MLWTRFGGVFRGFRWLALAGLACAAACGDDGAAGTSGGVGAGGGGSAATGSGGASTGSGGASAGGGGVLAGGGGASSGPGGGGGGAGSLCGDGIVEGAEICDDGNAQGGDYCAADCLQITGACGDGVLQGNETCDDGVVTSGCDMLADGGDGACLPPGTCSPGYVFVPGTGCVAEVATGHVHIDVDNFCNMSVMPMEFTVPPGQKLKLSYHNHSADYPVDVWLSYGGGYLDLQQGATWNDAFEHCFGPIASEAYADISTACSSFQLQIHCL